ncbi:MAG: hypothetical protein M1823_001357 [Watsoniomyces obsoletus]|nr:MAG: hypothetical protein M1823_001357 [Watsoniomyces obsoletus]
MSERVKEAVVEEVDRVKALSQEAARSGAYLYPLKGIAYFFAHRSLWQPLMSRLVPTITLSIGVVTFMFIFAYLPQAAILSIFNGPIAVLSSILLTLSESSTIITLLSKNFLIEDALLDTFDGTLVSRNMTDFVSEGRQIKAGNDPISKLGKIAKRPFEKFTPQAIIRYFMYLPLNFIPVIGTLLFLTMQGRRTGPTAHNRYFQLKKWSPAQREAWAREHTPAYTSFGVVAVLLELVPLASIFFAFTNTVGAALWASDLERSQHTTAPKLKDDASKAE